MSVKKANKAVNSQTDNTANSQTDNTANVLNENSANTIEAHQNFKKGIAESVEASAPNNNLPEVKYNGFHGSKETRIYSTPTIDMSLVNVDIPEVKMEQAPPPTHEQHQSTLNDAPPLQTPQEPTGTHSQPSAINNLAQDVKQQTHFNTLSPLEQKQGTEMSAEIVISAYEGLHNLVRKSITVSRETLITKHQEGKIDVNEIFIPAESSPDGNPITNLQFYDSFNTQVNQEFIVTNDFKDKVRPPLQRLAQKFGLAASDEVYVAVAFGTDILQKGIMFKQFKSVVNDSIKAMEESFSNRKKLTEEYINSQIENGVKDTRTKMEALIKELNDKLEKAEAKAVA